MKKILSIGLGVVVVAGAGLTWFVTREPASAFEGARQETTPSPELIARGEYVARLGDCVACHSVPEGKPFAGGLPMGTPLGAIYTTNITPDSETGIGNYSLADFDRALRHGVAPGGKRLYPAMPYPSYQKMSDEDIQALYAYFMHGVEPVRQANHPVDIPWPLDTRWPLALWNQVFARNSDYSTDNDAQWQRGAYLVQGAGHCGSCHTPRGLAMNEKALDERSPEYLSGALLDGWYAPSLRNDPNTGLGRWSEQDVFDYLRHGRNPHGVVFGSMADAFNNSTQFMTDADLQAIAHYLKSLPGDPQRDGQPWQYQQANLTELASENPGAAVYQAKCSFCHGADGRGQSPWIPPLAGTAASLTEHDASAINVTLNGSPRVVANGIPDSYRMPPYRAQLSDQEVAQVLSFIRGAWGNHGGAVSAERVGEMRGHTDPASSEVIILQMR